MSLRPSPRGTAVHRRAHPHVPVEHPSNPGCCTCGLPMAVNNQLHKPAPTPPEVAAAEQRRTGDHD